MTIRDELLRDERLRIRIRMTDERERGYRLRDEKESMSV